MARRGQRQQRGRDDRERTHAMADRLWPAGGLAAAALLVGGLMTEATAQAAPPLRQILGLASPMRDGVKLSSDVWLPREPGRYPIILIRTPYLKGLGFLQEQAELFARRGYAVVVQDTRGRGDSEGEFSPFFQEPAD